jgi:hypothetical protein
MACATYRIESCEVMFHQEKYYFRWAKANWGQIMMSQKNKREFFEIVHPCYLKASKFERQKVLDE